MGHVGLTLLHKIGGLGENNHKGIESLTVRARVLILKKCGVFDY